MSHTVFQPPAAPKQHTTEKVTLWVKPAVKAELKRLAELDGLTLSKTGAALLEAGIHKHLHRLMQDLGMFNYLHGLLGNLKMIRMHYGSQCSYRFPVQTQCSNTSRHDEAGLGFVQKSISGV